MAKRAFFNYYFINFLSTIDVDNPTPGFYLVIS